ncbi:MAG: hemolysin family protein [Dehalococcoidia bacterium]|nr:hemolysin family protein [Dehalococcoidia bacterium]
MEADLWVGLVLLIAALALLVLVTAAEAGVVSISRSRVRSAAGKGRADALEAYLNDRRAVLESLAVARDVALVASIAIGVFLVLRETGHTWAALAVTAFGALLVLALLQALPRLLVTASPERWSLRLAPLARALKVAFAVPAWLLRLPGRALMRLLRREPEAAEEVSESEEIVRMMEIEEGNGPIEEPERRMIRAIINLEETSVHEIMVPRIDIAAVPTDATLEDATQIIMEKGFSRVPLYEETIDNVVGVLYAKDIMKFLASGGTDRSAPNLRDLARPPFFVPESKKVDELLADMRANRVHMGIVVDEYGGTAGLVTIEDLLEEIVGEIEDEYDREEPTVEKIDENELVVDARVGIDDLNELLGLEIEGEDFDTVGGFVYHHLGKIPIVGEEVQADGVRLKVLSVAGRRIKKVQVRKEEPPPSNDNNPKHS